MGTFEKVNTFEMECNGDGLVYIVVITDIFEFGGGYKANILEVGSNGEVTIINRLVGTTYLDAKISAARIILNLNKKIEGGKDGNV